MNFHRSPHCHQDLRQAPNRTLPSTVQTCIRQWETWEAPIHVQRVANAPKDDGVNMQLDNLILGLDGFPRHTNPAMEIAQPFYPELEREGQCGKKGACKEAVGKNKAASSSNVLS